MASTSMEAFRNKLEKRYGGRLTRVDKGVRYDVIPTGSMTLDIALGTGGLVQGRTHEIVGPPGAAKTSLCTMTAAQAQQIMPDKAVGWIDMEQSFDFEWAERLGLDTEADRFTHMYPDDSEDVSDMLSLMAQSALFGLIVIDSIGGMESKKAFEKDAEDVVMGKNAQVITRMVKRAAVLAREHGITIIYVNQLRANLSGMGNDKPAGPKALGYNTTTSIKMARKGGPASDTILTTKVPGEKEPVPVGYRFVAKVQRSRVSPQGRSAEFWLVNAPDTEHGDVGLYRADEALSLGTRTGVVRQSGAFYTLPGESKAIQGQVATREALTKRPDLMDRIREEALKLVAHTVIEETETSYEEAPK